jgi:hypothetical protein
MQGLCSADQTAHDNAAKLRPCTTTHTAADESLIMSLPGQVTAAACALAHPEPTSIPALLL